MARWKQSLLAEGENSGEQRKAAVLAEDSSKSLVFFPERKDVGIHMNLLRSQQQVEVFCFNPMDGSVMPEGNYPALGVQRFLPPDGWEDAVLVLKSIGQPVKSSVKTKTTGGHTGGRRWFFCTSCAIGWQ